MEIKEAALQTILIEVDANTQIVGEAPQFTYIDNIKIDITSAMPFWSIQKILKNGIKTIIRNAEGDELHNKILDDWNTFTY